MPIKYMKIGVRLASFPKNVHLARQEVIQAWGMPAALLLGLVRSLDKYIIAVSWANHPGARFPKEISKWTAKDYCDKREILIPAIYFCHRNVFFFSFTESPTTLMEDVGILAELYPSICIPLYLSPFLKIFHSLWNSPPSQVFSWTFFFWSYSI